MTAENSQDKLVDVPPAKKLEVEDEEEEEPPMPVQEFKFYLQPEVTFKIISTKWGVFTAIGGFVYLYHLLFAIAGVNNYSDISRTLDCNKNI